MEQLKRRTTNLLLRIFKKEKNLDKNIIQIITNFLYRTSISTGSILIDINYYQEHSLRRLSSQQLFIVMRRTKHYCYVRELTYPTAYRERISKYNKLGQMIRVYSNRFDYLDRVEIYTPGEQPFFKVFLELTDDIRDLEKLLPDPLKHVIKFATDKYYTLKPEFS